MASVVTKKLVALPDGVAGAGAIVWWSLSGRVHPEMLEEALSDEGFSIKVPLPTPGAALRQAVGKLVGKRASKAHGVIALKAERDAWFLVERHLLDGGNDVSLAAFARVEVVSGAEGVDFVVADMGRGGPIGMAEAVCSAARALYESVGTARMSSWISAVHANVFEAVALRETGGFYYVPPVHRAGLAAFWRALGYVSNHRASTIDAMPTEETVSAVVEAMRREYDAAFEDLRAEVESGVNMTKKGRASRIERLDALREKIRTYAGLLGGAAEALDDKVSEAYALIAMGV